MREKFESILNDYGIYGVEVEDVTNAVHDMLVCVADDTKDKYPYATNSIDRLEKAAYEVFSLTNEL